MEHQEKKIRVLLAQFPLETHSRGIITVAGMLRDAGMEVVLLGNALSEQIIMAAVQEFADVIGISTYCGGELALGSDLLKAAEKAGIKESTVFIMGGIFPPKNAPELEKVGFSATFPPSSTKEDIVSSIKNAVASKRRAV
jgi:methylmalonyl-CoA mutase C-terminal domain/subunit